MGWASDSSCYAVSCYAVSCCVSCCRSPESLTSGYQPSFEMDMWALGVCIYIWVFGCLPFTGGAPFIIYEKIRAQDISMPSAPDVSVCGVGGCGCMAVAAWLWVCAREQFGTRVGSLGDVHMAGRWLVCCAKLCCATRQSWSAWGCLSAACASGDAPSRPASCVQFQTALFDRACVSLSAVLFLPPGVS